MKKMDIKKLFALGAVALASGAACAQTSSVQLYGIVDVAFRHTTNEGPAVLTLTADKGDTVVALVVRKQAAAAKAGMLPPQGKVKLLFGNILDGAASVTIDKKKVAVPAGTGGKAPDGPTLDIAPGKHTFSFTLPGQAARTDEIDVASGDVWGLMIGPGGVLAVPMY